MLMKTHNHKNSKSKMSLGDLISIVGSCSRNDRETLAAVTDLLESGRVRLQSGTHARRVHVSNTVA